jgi:hypothetical protein
MRYLLASVLRRKARSQRRRFGLEHAPICVLNIVIKRTNYLTDREVPR